MNRFIIVTFTILFFISTVYCFENVEIIKSDQTSIILELKPFEIHFRDIVINGSQFQQIESFDQFTFSLTEGHPQLPVIGLLLGVPFSSSPLVKVLEAQYEEIGDISIIPSPSFKYFDNDVGGYMNKEYRADEKIYSINQFYPTLLAEIVSIQTFRSQRIAKLELHPVQYNPQIKTLRKFTKLTVQIIYQANQIKKNNILPEKIFDSIYRKILVNHSVAKNWQDKIKVSHVEQSRATDDWYNPEHSYYKLLISKDGIYHLNYHDLLNVGIPINSIDPQTIKIYYMGHEIPIFVSGEEDGIFQPQDFIEFYPEQKYGETSYFNDYSNANVYWMTFGGDTGLRIAEQTSISGDYPEFSSFQKHVHIEQDLSYYHGDESSTIIQTKQVPGESWIWKIFYEDDQHSFPLSLENIDLETTTPCTIEIKLRGITIDPVSPDHQAIFILNGSSIGEVYFDNREEIVFKTTFNQAILREGINNLLIKSGNTGAEINSFYLDWIEVSYLATNQLKSSKLRFDSPINHVAKISLWNLCSDTVGIYNLTRNYFLSQYEVHDEQRFIFKIISAGFEDGNIAYIRINSDYVIDSGHRGHNIAVFDTTTGMLKDNRWFDTLESTENSDSMAAYISRIPKGHIVLVAIRDEGSYHMTETAYQALESLGSALTRQIKFRDSWVLIGRKGAIPGSVPELLVPRGAGMAIIKDTLWTYHDYSKHIVFQDQLQQGDKFFIAAIDTMQKPDQIIFDRFQDLKNGQLGADYIFITHENFRPTAEKLAAFWADRNYRTIVVDVQDIYDQFNFGIKHVRAIKDFLAYAYYHWKEPAPSFVLLIGDASWDPKKNSPASVKEDFVPTYGNPVSDHWFVCLDGDDDLLPEMFIGRLAIETEEQGDQIIEKIKTYESLPSAEWKKHILFINGGFNDNEQLLFAAQTKDIISNYVTPAPSSCIPYVISKELDGLYEGEKREDIIQAINEGKLWVNFIGHGGSGTWELMFHNEQIQQLQNAGRLPFITSFTCHTGRFANPEINSFAENFVTIPDIGAIGFMGTTGWGFVYEDDQLAKKLFESILKDTVHQLGEAIALAKIKFWEAFYNGIFTQSVIEQYSLIGDPAINLTLPEQPDLTIKQTGLTLIPQSPIEEDSIITLNLQIKNYGLMTQDSVELKILDKFNLNNTSEIFRGITKPIGYSDSIIIPWSISNKAGAHILESIVDPEDVIAEAVETNNQTIFSIYIGSSRISVSMPAKNQVITETHPRLQINNPVSKKEITGFYFEIDTTMSFDSDFLIQSPLIPEGPIITNWSPTQVLQRNKLYYWRCRIDEIGGNNNWITSLFSIDDQFGWAQKKYNQFKDNSYIDTELTFAGVQLLHEETIFRVESSGYDDLNYAVIFINSTPVATATRGHNIAICDQYGNFIEFRNFDSHDSPEDVASMTIFLNEIPRGHYVLIGIMDSGEQMMNEAAYQVLESIGSQYCRQVEFRDAWAIIGQKGALIGAVPEQLVKRFHGTAIVEDTLTTYNRNGEVISPPIGPSNNWKTLTWTTNNPHSGSAVTMDVLAFNKIASHWDTLLTNMTNNSGESLTAINSNTYPIIKLKANLQSNDDFHTPILQHWSVTFDPVSDIAIGDKTVEFSADTVIDGEIVNINAKIYNSGYVDEDSVKINFLYLDPDHGKTVFAEKKLLTVKADSFETITLNWNSSKRIGNNQVFIEIDPDNQINELSETNNYFSKGVAVLADTTQPYIIVTFDGKQIADGEYVSTLPVILINIHDNSPLSINNDTTKIHLLLDHNRVNYLANESNLIFLPLDNNQDITLKAQIRFVPHLSDGNHELELIVIDVSNNSTYYHLDFKIESELKILDVLNCPNPFRNDTYFTYFLTQPADDVTIKIYTVAGRLIRAIDYAPGEAGFNKFYWNGLDQDYDELANGVYLYKISARSGTKKVEQIEKFIIMR